MQKNDFGPFPHTTQKIKSKWITTLNARAKTIKLLEEIRGVNLELVMISET